MNNFELKLFNKDKNYVIEASAGTGKTFNIVEIVNKLVNEHHVDLNKILIVTYTEKAAGELKNRIRDKLKNVDVDNASIYTIHSFCQNTIKEFGLSANLPFNLSVIDENEIYKFTDRYIREGAIVDDIAFLYQFLPSFNIDNINELFVKCVQMYYLDLNGKEDPSIISLGDTTFHQELLDICKCLYNKLTFEDFLEQNQTFKTQYLIIKGSSHKNAAKFSMELKNTFEDNFNFSGSTFNKNAFKGESEIVQTAFKYFTKIKEYLKKPKPDLMIASKYLKDFYLKWQIEKENNKSQNFDDMIRYVRESIIHDELLKNKLKAKYSRAIIDEFQDTNQRQFDIFKSIFMEDDDHKIIVVGDPKQSIYSFQGADVNVYYDAVDFIEQISGEKCMLSKNYRSTADMVAACNALFNYYDFKGTTFTDCGYLSKELGDEKYHEVLYNGTTPKAFWIAEGSNHEPINENEFAMIAVQQIIDCCTLDENGRTKLQIKDKDKEYRNVSFKDFAVLAKVKTEMPAIEKALKNVGIPYMRYKNNQLFIGKECYHWITLLKAINLKDFTGKNRNILKKALYTKFFGLTLEQINSDYVNKDDIVEIELINKWKQFAYLNQYEDLFDDIITNSRLSDNMKSLKEIQSFAIYKQISNYCIEYLSKGKTLEELIRTLIDLSKGGDYEGDDMNGTIVEKSTNFDCVQIMTIHASKGLQFPVVIALGGYKGPYNKNKVFKCHQEDSSGKLKQIMIFENNDDVKNEEMEEVKRQFYVAYTRPQFLLLLPKYQRFGYNFLENSLDAFLKENANQCHFIHKANITYKELRKRTSKILSKLGQTDNDLESKQQQDLVLKTIIKDTKNKKVFKHSYSSLSHEKIQIENNEDSFFENKEGLTQESLSMFDKSSKQIIADYNELIKPITLPLDYPHGAKLGTALHEVFEKLDFENYELNIEQKIIKCFSKQGVNAKEEWITSTKEIVNNVLLADLPVINGSSKISETFKLNSISYENKLDEVEFNFNILNKKLKNFCNGFVDLIFKRGEYYSIVDWKSDRLNDTFESYATPFSLKQHVDDCYSIQRVLYSYCLIKWLKLSMQNLTEQEIFEKHFGGVYYIFLRGCNQNTGNGIYAQTWNSWNDLENSYRYIIKARIGGISNE